MPSIFQAFIDSMRMSNNTLTYKELIQSVRYARLVVSLTRTLTIVISEYMKSNRLRQRPQVRHLLEIALLILLSDLFYIYSYRALMRLSVLDL